MMQQQISQLLDEVTFKIGTLREARARFSDRLAPDFNIFDYLRSDELGFSRCIAGLLDPNGTHGQGNVFLEAFLDCIGSAAKWATNSTSCQVITEKQANGQRRVDIYLKFPSGAIGIENKPWAGDQKNQLLDYATYLKENSGGRNWLLVFLCDRDPSVESLPTDVQDRLTESDQFVRCSYSEIIRWLEICSYKAKALNVRVFLEELANFIKIKIQGELEMSYKKEISESIIMSKENLSSAFEILKTIDHVKKDLLEKFKNDLARELRLAGFYLEWDSKLESIGKLNTGFGIKFTSDQNLYLRFEFEATGLNNFFWGIKKESASIQKNVPLWNSIYALMENEFHIGNSGSVWWPWFSTNTQDVFEAEIQNWGNSHTPWMLILEKGDDSLVKKILMLVNRTRTAFDGNIHLLKSPI